jgi:hypothetical protein
MRCHAFNDAMLSGRMELAREIGNLWLGRLASGTRGFGFPQAQQICAVHTIAGAPQPKKKDQERIPTGGKGSLARKRASRSIFERDDFSETELLNTDPRNSPGSSCSTSRQCFGRMTR